MAHHLCSAHGGGSTEVDMFTRRPCRLLLCDGTSRLEHHRALYDDVKFAGDRWAVAHPHYTEYPLSEREAAKHPSSRSRHRPSRVSGTVNEHGTAAHPERFQRSSSRAAVSRASSPSVGVGGMTSRCSRSTVKELTKRDDCTKEVAFQTANRDLNPAAVARKPFGDAPNRQERLVNSFIRTHTGASERFVRPMGPGSLHHGNFGVQRRTASPAGSRSRRSQRH